MKALIIVPTYNERENLPRLVEQIFAQEVPVQLEVLVVDDNSPDGTGRLADDMAQADPRMHVLHREKKMGLGQAYIAGFKQALTMDADYIFEMDADFSHNPERIPQFIEAIKTSDVVIGSRYVGGRVNVTNWPIRRLILSYCANIYTRIITRLPLADTTAGFKCIRREALAALDLDAIVSDGYAFQIEMHYKWWMKGFRLMEIPIVFTDRYKGKSKMSRHIIWEAIWMVWRLRIMGLTGKL
jgi:dolichol-phosphate mannosyltransferase